MNPEMTMENAYALACQLVGESQVAHRLALTQLKLVEAERNDLLDKTEERME